MKSLALLVLSAAACSAYVNAVPFNYRTDNENIQFLVNANSANANNAKGEAWVTPGSNVLSAAIAAMNSWSSIPSADIHFAAPKVTTLNYESGPDSNVISFDLGSEATQALNSAVAVTASVINTDNSIASSNVLLGTTEQFSTNGAASAFDLQSILTHELGHCLGASHSGVFSAVMFQATDVGLTDQAHLKPDDIAFATFTYPVANSYGTIAGTLRDVNGKPLRGALITAEDPATGVVIGGLSDVTDGSISFIVPPGNYYVWAQPLTGQVTAPNVYLDANQVDTNWQPVIAGGFNTPATVQVQSRQTVTVALAAQVPALATPITLNYAGFTPVSNPSEQVSEYTGPTDMPGGQSVYFIFQANGLSSSVNSANFQPVGPFTIEPGSLVALGSDTYQLTLDLPPVSELTTASLLMTYNGSVGMFSGGIVLQPPTPSVPGNGIVNAFSSAGSAVAPGEIVSIYGTDLGPTDGLGGQFTNAGFLAAQLDGISVRFDGVPGSLFYSASGQINVQVPYEVAGQANTSVVVDTGLQSAPVSLPVSSAAPGLFVNAVNFPANTLNTAANPANRGDFVILYATGLGSPVTPLETGQAATDADDSANPVIANVGGVAVQPYYAGVSPGYTGLDQISVQIPTGIPAGQTTLYVTSASGLSSQTISVWVQ